MPNPTLLHESATQLADRVAQSADGAIHATQAATNRAFDRLSSSVHTARNRADPWVGKAATRAQQASDYVQGQPLKSLVIAAAAGAAVVTLIGWVSRLRSSRRY